MSAERDYLTLGIITAIVAHNMTAVEHMIRGLVPIDPKWAEQVLEAVKRGNDNRKVEP